MNIEEELKKAKPNITESTLRTYKSVFNSVSRQIGDEITLEKLQKDPYSIIDKLRDVPLVRKKTFLSILVNLTNGETKEIYRKNMLTESEKYITDLDKNEPIDEPTSLDEVKELLDELENKARYIYKKKEMSMEDYMEVQKYIILVLLGGIFIPPRRLMDYNNFKIKNIDKEKDNYLEGQNMIFNSYKTSKTYGKQIIKIPVKLKNILNKWIAVNPTDYLLFDTKLEKLSSSNLNKILNGIFGGRKISVNTLRTTYINTIYPEGLPTTENLKKVATEMGHSIDTALNYRTKSL